MASKIENSIGFVQFENHNVPQFLEKTNKEWISYGENNNYPDYIVELFNRHAENGAIIRGKANYIFGKGLTFDPSGLNADQLQALNTFLNRANRYGEDMNDIYAKLCLSLSLYNGFALQVIWGAGQTITDIFFIEMSFLRRSKDGKKVFYCENWILPNGNINHQPEKDSTFKCFDLFNSNVRVGTQILYHVVYNPTSQKFSDLYPVADYQQCVSDIETDIEITNFHRSNVKTGFSAGAMLTLFNGEPDETAKKKILERFKRNYTGTDVAGGLILNFAPKGGQKAEVTPLTPPELDKQFEQLAQRIQQKVFTGHGVPNVGLFGIQVAGKLGTREELREAYELWKTTYISQRQEIIVNVLTQLAKINGCLGDLLEPTFTDPIGFDWTDPNINKFMTVDEVREKLGLPPIENVNNTSGMPTQQVVPASADAPKTEVKAESEINEHLKGLKGREFQALLRIVNQYKKGQINKATALMMMQAGYNLSEEQALLFLDEEKQDKEDKTNTALGLFAQFAHDSNDDETLHTEFVSFKSMDEAKNYEYKFANPYEDSKRELKQGILDIIKGNPFVKPEEIAKQLQVDIVEIQNVLGDLITNGFIDDTEGSFMPTEKTLDKDIPSVETQTYTEYSYEVRGDVPTAKSGSRPFCKVLTRLSKEGKRWTREALEKIENELNEPIWDYRGGFYTNPNTGETTPFCRHIWKAHTKIKRKK